MDDFTNALLKASRRKQKRYSEMDRLSALHRHNNMCVYCSAPLDEGQKNSWGVLLAIPDSMGGRNSTSNRVPSCIACIQLHATSDGLFGRSEYSDMRKSNLVTSANHLTQFSPRTNNALGQVTNELHKRHRHERFTAYISVTREHAYIGLTVRSGSEKRVGEVATLIAYGFKAKRLDASKKHWVYQIERTRLHELTTALISENAYLKLLMIPESIDHHTLCGTSYFERAYHNIHDVIRRKTGNETPAPMFEQPKSNNAATVRSNRRHSKERLERTRREAQLASLRIRAGVSSDLAERDRATAQFLRAFLDQP